MTPIWPGRFGIALLDREKTLIKQLPLPRLPIMTCKPESKKQRLERIAVQVLSGLTANSHEGACALNADKAAGIALTRARELIKQLDALPLDE